MMSRKGIFLIAALTVSLQGLSAPMIPPGALEALKRASPAEQLRVAEQYGVSIGDIQAVISGQQIDRGAEDGGAGSSLPPTLGSPGNTLEQVSLVEPQDPVLRSAEDAELEEAENDVLATSLPRFGSGIFDKDVTTFAPVDNIPVPQGYLLGVGDNLTVLLYGNDNVQAELIINREGTVNFPLLGPIVLAGMPWVEARRYIEARVSEQLIGTKVVASLGRLKSISIFIAGEVVAPGTYSVSALTTIIQSIYVAGGITPIGSYRDIQVKRAGKTVATLDLYDLLLRGTLADDLRLQTNDVVFVPAALPRIGIRGEVLRPAQFEVRPKETLADVLMMAGGTTSLAYLEAAVLQRRDPDKVLPELLNFDLRSVDGLRQVPLDGDLLTVKKQSDRIQNPIALRGAFERPGVYAWNAGTRLSTFIRGSDGNLKLGADRDIGIIVRRSNERLDIKVLPFSPMKVLKNPGFEEDALLVGNDEVYIFDRLEMRSETLAPVTSALEVQATQSAWPQTVTVAGAVKDPGKYPLVVGATLADLVRLIGGESVFGLNVDLQVGLIVRRKHDSNEVEAIPFNLNEALNDPESEANLLLAPLDELLIFNKVDSEDSNRLTLMAPLIAKLKSQATLDDAPKVMTIDGRVRLPGEYPLLRPNNVSSLIDLAGGFAEGAYTKKAEILRVSTDINQERYTEIIEVTLDLEAAVENIQLKSRDALRVNTMPGWTEQNIITLSGEVRFPGIYHFEKGETLGSVVLRAGGLTKDAFAKGAVYNNLQAAINQRKQSDAYLKKVRSSAISRKLSDDLSGTQESTVMDESLYDSLENAITGRVTIDLPMILSKEALDSDIYIQNGDTLTVPVVSNYVGVVGDVFSPGNFRFKPKLGAKAFIKLAGGVTRYGDLKRAFILKADGRVVSLRNSKAWFSRGDKREKLGAGDFVVVPSNPDYEKPLAQWQAVTSVVFQSFASIAAFFTISDR